MLMPSDHWRLLVLLIAVPTVVPLLVICLPLTAFDREIWSHLLEYQLPTLLRNTFWLVLGVGAGVCVLGVSLAWLTAMYHFPGSRFFRWALMLPLAMPAYVMAFAQQGIFDFSGPLQMLIRAWLGSSDWVPDIRSTWGVVLVMSLAFYPYVYLLARNAFAGMGRRALEAGQSLGLSPWQGFWRVALPMARPWVAGGMSLALMETLADFGTVSIFNFDTFTTAIYQAWFSFFSLQTAQQLASLLVGLVFVLVWLEQRSRGRRAYTPVGRHAAPLLLILRGWRRWAACAFCALVLFIAFLLPLGQLLWWAADVWRDDWGLDLLRYAFSSFSLSAMAAALIAAVALLLAYAQRRDASRFTGLIGRLAVMGYAIPGTVLAVGVFAPVAWLDNLLIDMFAWPSGTTAVFKGTLLVMLLAYLARFLAVGHSAVGAAMHHISRSQEDAARSLGSHGLPLLGRLYLPQLSGGLLTAALMVFVDVMKEMPITLMTRPFGWDTLAVRIFNFTSEGEWARAALPSLIIVAVGLVPVIWLAGRSGAREDDESVIR